MTTLREPTDAKLDRLLAFARAHPAAYERRVLLFALLGYAYLVGILLLIVALMVGLALFLYGWAQAGALAALFTGVWIALITLGFTVLNAFTFTAPAPKGVLLDRVDSPELISLIEELRLQLHSAAIDEVLLTWEPGAACQQRVRFGPFGPTRRYLLLGLPALIAATPVELRAILAHEIGHLSTTNGRATAWVNGVRETWLRLLLALHEKRSLTTDLFARIFGWYMSPFQRYSFALARQQETSADQAAAKICGAANLADALVRLAMLGRAIGRDVGLTVGMASFEGLAPAARTRELMRSQQDLAVSRRDLNAVLADDLDMDDAHPPLGARLASLGTEPRVPAPATTTAAGLYLGRRLDELCARVDELWRAESPLAKLVANSGTTIRQEIATATEELARLETSAIAQSNIEDLRRRAKLTEWLRGANAALPIYDALAARDDPAGLAGAGRIRLATGDSSGLDLIDRAIALDRSTGALAASEARDFLVAEGRTEDAAKYGEILREEGAEAAATYAVRAQIRSDDEIAAHDLAPDVVAAIAETLSRVKPVARAYLVRKVIPESPGPGPLFLALVYRTSWFIGTDQADANTLTARISEAITHLVPDVTVVVANGWAGTKKVEERSSHLGPACPDPSARARRAVRAHVRISRHEFGAATQQSGRADRHGAACRHSRSPVLGAARRRRTAPDRGPRRCRRADRDADRRIHHRGRVDVRVDSVAGAGSLSTTGECSACSGRTHRRCRPVERPRASAVRTRCPRRLVTSSSPTAPACPQSILKSDHEGADTRPVPIGETGPLQSSQTRPRAHLRR